jgi:hypothetical protein
MITRIIKIRQTVSSLSADHRVDEITRALSVAVEVVSFLELVDQHLYFALGDSWQAKWVVHEAVRVKLT